MVISRSSFRIPNHTLAIKRHECEVERQINPGKPQQLYIEIAFRSCIMKEMQLDYTGNSTITQRGVSGVNRQRLALLHRHLPEPFTVTMAMELWATDRGETQRILAHLAANGWLVRLKRGLYATTPLDALQPEQWRLEPWLVAAQAFAPMYIGGWSACEYWQLTEQLFRSVVVFSARPHLRARRQSIQHTEYVIKSVAPEKLFGTRTAWLGQQQVAVSDPSRTLVDLLDDPAIGGGMAHVADVLAAYFDGAQRDNELLLAYIEQHGNRTIYKRLGYLVQEVGVDAPQLLNLCRLRMSRGVSLLDPSSPPKGKRRSDWNLQINVTLPVTHRLESELR